ncbi:OLC1v1012620C1 [Oldenlandia corymbosa var. corymbosa]|uniref:OLC1v1012620C1 n=1 Tax=Oldenlandia corymbosa var. corymbosa TaxID=529605 RepID=A0AAV1DWI9_OLDCO|nr:OLC1v1012620C1 [Oldenlandia corymbosa var. corymbosa]
MDSIIDKERQEKENSEEDKATRRKRKFTCLMIFFIALFFVIIVSVISVFVAIKKDLDAESLSASHPKEHIRTICELTTFPNSCFKPISKLQSNYLTKSRKTNPTAIFMFFHQAAFDQLNIAISRSGYEYSNILTLEEDSAVESASLKLCNILIWDSLTQVNMSMALLEADYSVNEMFRLRKIKVDLERLIVNATDNMNACSRLEYVSEELRMKISDSVEYLNNCEEILRKMDRVIEMFNPPLFPGVFVFGYESVSMLIVFYGSPYLFLLFLLYKLIRMLK